MPKIHILDKNAGTPEARWDSSYEDEYLYWPRVAWLDPGVVSGLAVVWFDAAALFAGETLRTCLLAMSGEYLRGPEREQVGRYATAVRSLARGAEGDAPGLAVGVESFVPRMISYDRDFLAPVRIRAMAEYALPEYAFAVQSPADALGSWGNDRLKALGMYQAGPDHINDARRHALLWIQRLRHAGVEHFYGAHGRDVRWGLDRGAA